LERAGRQQPQEAPLYVWGAFFGLVISAFQVDPAEPLTLVLVPAAGMAIGSVGAWALGRLLRFTFVTPPRFIFGGIRRIVKGEHRKPPV
jgi:hypothetical protein